MARLAGEWAEPTLTGTRMLVVGDREFMIPADAVVKLVNPKGKHPTAHVRYTGGVAVLSADGQLVESDAEAVKRAGADAWRAVAGDPI